MNTPYRTSPVHDQLKLLNASWCEINGMQSVFSISGDRVKAARLGIADLSFLSRFGVKGAGAAAWLEGQGISVPPRPNSWCPMLEGGLVARLGINEFLIEDSLHTKVADRLTEACQQPPAKVYPVLRQDAAIALCGEAVNELLLQTCNVNFRAMSLAERSLALTSIVGVALIVIPGEQAYRIWCDGTYGAYLWRTLLAIAQELGGGAVGAEVVKPLIG
jgi:sarcosine oxidase subunit gamma